MASENVQPAGAATAGAASYGNVERVGFGLLMIGAPILLLGAAFIHPPHSIESGPEYYHAAHDHTTAFYVAHSLFFLAAVLFVPAVVGLARLVHRSHPKAAFWGVVLTLMGFVGYGAMDGMDYMTWVAGNPASGLDSKEMQQFIDVTINTTAIMAPVMLIFLLLPIGLSVLAVGLHRAGIRPLWLGVLMPVGMVGVAASLDYPVLLVLSALFLLASFGLVGVRLLRTPNGTLSEAAPV
jgi:hypothetical protein